jgi:hypothetical protein
MVPPFAAWCGDSASGAWFGRNLTLSSAGSARFLSRVTRITDDFSRSVRVFRPRHCRLSCGFSARDGGQFFGAPELVRGGNAPAIEQADDIRARSPDLALKELAERATHLARTAPRSMGNR